VGKVHLLDEVPSLGHVQDRELVVEVTHPGKGKVRQVGSPFKLSETPVKIRRHTPAFGEHTEEVVLEAGFNRAELQAFKDKGVCN